MQRFKIREREKNAKSYKSCLFTKPSNYESHFHIKEEYDNTSANTKSDAVISSVLHKLYNDLKRFHENGHPSEDFLYDFYVKISTLDFFLKNNESYNEYVELQKTVLSLIESYVDLSNNEKCLIVTTYMDAIVMHILGCENSRKYRFSPYFLMQIARINNFVCPECGKKITSSDDASVDHNIPYWLVGDTIPNNLRVVHRHCNTRKSNYLHIEI